MAGVKGVYPNRYTLADFAVGQMIYVDGDYSTPVRVSQLSAPSSMAIGNTVLDWRWIDVASVPTQPADMPWYMREVLVDRKWSSASGGAPSRAYQESRGIPQPSGWNGDRPTYNDAAQRAADAAGLPLPVWAQRGDETPVHSISDGAIVTQFIPPAPAPPVVPPQIPPPAPPPLPPVVPTANIGAVITGNPAPPAATSTIPAPLVPAAQQGGDSALGVGIGGLILLGLVLL